MISNEQDEGEEDEFFGNQSSSDEEEDEKYKHSRTAAAATTTTTSTIPSLSKHESQSQEKHFHKLGYHEAYDEYKDSKHELQRGFEEGYKNNVDNAFDIGQLLGQCVFVEHTKASDGARGANTAASLVIQYLKAEQVKDGGDDVHVDDDDDNMNNPNNNSKNSFTDGGNRKDKEKGGLNDTELENKLKEVLEKLKTK